MTNEEAEKILFYHRSTGNLSPMLNEALDLAISALSKQSASSKQADKKLFDHGYWILPGEVFISHNALNEVLNTIIKSMDTVQCKIDSTLVKTSTNDEAIRKDDQIAESDKMVDQFRDTAKKTDDVPDTNVGKTDFQPGDKFILELGAERKMFGEFEIKGTDLYVKTDLLEKLTRYEPEVKTEKIPYKKVEIIHCESCKHWTHTPLNGYGLGKCDFHDDDLVTRYGSCGSAERRNDG